VHSSAAGAPAALRLFVEGRRAHTPGAPIRFAWSTDQSAISDTSPGHRLPDSHLRGVRPDRAVPPRPSDVGDAALAV